MRSIRREFRAEDVMRWSRGEDLAHLALHERMTAVLADDWRQLTVPPRPIISAPRAALLPPTSGLITSFAGVGSREKALAAGRDSHIEKPIDPATVAEEIARFRAPKRPPPSTP